MMRSQSDGSTLQRGSDDAGNALIGEEAFSVAPASESKSKVPFHRHVLMDTWVPEISATVLMLLCLVAIGVILKEYQGKPIPDLPWGLTLNAIISTLTTCSKSLLLYAISVSISQSKWAWFKRRQPLQDLQTFDEASRGPLGSMGLLSGRTVNSVASLGAATMILALAFEPFVQQVVEYSVESVKTPSPFATAKKATSFAGDSFGDYVMSSTMSGIWAYEDTFQTIPSCPTQNCTWPSVQSIGWCNKCVDVTSSTTLDCQINSDFAKVSAGLVSTRQPCTVNFPDGSQIVYTANVSLATSDDWVDPSNTTVFYYPQILIQSLQRPRSSNSSYLGVADPVLAMGQVNFSSQAVNNTFTDLTVASATQCVLSLCSRETALLLRQGHLSTNILSINYGRRYNRTFEGVEDPVTCWAPDDKPSSFEPLPAPSDYDRDPVWVDVSSSAFCVANAQWGRTLQYVLSGVQTMRVISGSDAYFEDGPFFEGSAAPITLEHVGDKGLGSIIEGISLSLSKLALDPDNHTVSGFAFASETLVRVRWQWLTLPFALALAGVILLASVMTRTRQGKILLWKSSVIAVIYHGLEERAERPINDPVSNMGVTAESTRVLLGKSETGKGLALHVQ
ncbi:hypothetical protein AbraIFM66950_005608 [Aspergillus brasiliensis]|nr:hypothetical protein AbraIFM66950_005608 [Aspergillus brasiliensis]